LTIYFIEFINYFIIWFNFYHLLHHIDLENLNLYCLYFMLWVNNFIKHLILRILKAFIINFHYHSFNLNITMIHSHDYISLFLYYPFIQISFVLHGNILTFSFYHEKLIYISYLHAIIDIIGKINILGTSLWSNNFFINVLMIYYNILMIFLIIF